MILDFLKRLPFRGLGFQCIIGVGCGALAGLLLGERCLYFQSLSDLYTRMGLLVSLPLIALILIWVFGSLSDKNLGILLGVGGLGILLLLVLAVVGVLVLPLMLPPLLSSPLFHPSLLEAVPKADLLKFLVPANLFSALAEGNLAAIVLCSIVVGLFIQKSPDKQKILELVNPFRLLLLKIMQNLVIRMAPLGLFFEVAIVLGGGPFANLDRVLGLLAMFVAGAILFCGLVFPAVVISTTCITWRNYFRALSTPLILSLATGQIIPCLPVFLQAFREEIWEKLPGRPRGRDDLAPVEAFAILGLAVFHFGKMLALMFVPFAGWFLDTPIGWEKSLRMMVTGIPATISGTYYAILTELPRVGLPSSLVSIYHINREWITRFGDIFGFSGALTVCCLIATRIRKTWNFRPERALAFGVVVIVLGFLLTVIFRSGLNFLLSGSHDALETIVNRTSLLDLPEAKILSVQKSPAVAPTDLAAIQGRGFLRAGVVVDAVPWVYHNRAGALVGYDMDLLKVMAQSLGVRLEVVPADLEHLTRLLREKRLDLMVGGIHADAIDAKLGQQAIAYEKVTLAVLVPDADVGRVPARIGSGEGGQLVLSYGRREKVSPDVLRAIEKHIPDGKDEINPSFLALENSFDPRVLKPADARLTSAEEGSAVAVIHPELTLIPVFGRNFTSEVAIFLPEHDEKIAEFLQKWVRKQNDLGLWLKLRQHWLNFN